ncbi:LEAF RUST 10 DISEASE-RESISTANCE LOCUS RECEPTOR-LIKE PROTEIN KINASE-like 1.2 isoform X2 [Macadamia integrifolia]|uniref:LEAF RUST 10 DISEASE-RESISTANCE LOCUS RECEPTOR-LIKE PROTEIN KINASE-like 1.2 isoform X2 n=1 Tax=Macadamia integrifolia TaxID=60698 RepID=UPI001C4EBF69|nr:LEAF RUST 10 DISEASE-RESISTANCE LOCUS RECEPTOR-LIKE PROTEIN KINASE-like 1.2 isoform X2 [Macadamia integrifolia]
MIFSFSSNPFPVLMISTTILLILLINVVIQEAKVLDPQYEACKPYSCGEAPNISYPFWIPLLEKPYCGHIGFEISCDGRKPGIMISDDSQTYHHISDIFYANKSLRVINAEVLKDDCDVPLHNLTLDDGTTHLSVAHSSLNLFFFYNCTTSIFSNYSIPVTCSSKETGNNSFAVFEHHLDFLYMTYSPYFLHQTCQSTVKTPVDMNGTSIGDYLSRGKSYSELLRGGFLLKWTENSSNCSGCQATGGRCGFYHKNFSCFCPNGPTPQYCTAVQPVAAAGKKRNLVLTLTIAFGSLGVGMILACVMFFICYRRRHHKGSLFNPVKGNNLSPSSTPLSRNIASNSSCKDPEKCSTYFGVHVFTYDELEEATNNFNSERELGDGGFGTVYHGKLRDGREVAVKRLYENNFKRVEQFMNEVDILTRIRHQSLVTLYGCTSRHSRELLLVYEFIPNGTVADHLHGDRKTETGKLSWPIRMSIAIETATALSYLHASDIIHRDVKTNNILLDNNFRVKVADFGLSRLFPTDVTHVSTAPQGTPGYVDPEYHQCYQLTDKSDVYSFGVVLIELISSMPAVDINRHRHEINLSNLAINKIKNQALHELVDPCLGYETECVVKRMITSVAELAFCCLQLEKEMRPSMDEVLKSLKQIEREDYTMEKAEGVVIQTDTIGLLKNTDPPFSPDSVTNNSQGYSSNITEN